MRIDFLFLLLAMLVFTKCTHRVAKNLVICTTNADESALFKWGTTPIIKDTLNSSKLPAIVVDQSAAFQKVDGFGFTLTGGSALLIRQMADSPKQALLHELFSTGPDGMGLSYLRISIGASDLSSEVFTYHDLPDGQTDENLLRFSLSHDTVALIPLLKEILAVNPNIKIMGSPWTAPIWMKTNKKSVGGRLLPQYYAAYAAYLVRYITEMGKNGIVIDAITPQNEPHHGGNNPSMEMSAEEQSNFIKNYLGPAFAAAKINTKIVIWDHNCDNPGFPIAVLNDPAAKKYIDGAAFHLYGGNIGALTEVHEAHPDKNLYFTEQWTGAKGSFSGDLLWHTREVMIGSMRNWSKIALEWNLANDPQFGPHTPGGCTECKGALTIDGNTVNRNVSYYVVGHFSRFVPPGSVRIGSTSLDKLPNVAFRTPGGKIAIIVQNDHVVQTEFLIKVDKKTIKCKLPGESIGSFILS